MPGFGNVFASLPDSLKIIAIFLLGDDYPKHFELVKDVISMSKVSSNWRIALQKLDLWSSLCFSTDLSVCYREADFEDAFFDEDDVCGTWKPFKHHLSACDVVITYMTYGGRNLKALEIALPVLNDKLLRAITSHLFFLERFSLYLPMFGGELSAGFNSETGEFPYFTEKGLITFFKDVAQLTHLEIVGSECGDISIYQSLFTKNVFSTIQERHFQLQGLGLKNLNAVSLFPFQGETESPLRFLSIGDINDLFYTGESTYSCVPSFCSQLESFPMCFKNMIKLEIYHSEQLNDTQLAEMVSVMTALQYLTIGVFGDAQAGGKVTDEGICAIACHCKQIRCLGLAGLFRITVVGVLKVVSECINMIELDISRSGALRSEDFEQNIRSILASGPSLRLIYIDLYDSFELTGPELAKLSRILEENPLLFLVRWFHGLIPAPQTLQPLEIEQRNLVENALHTPRKPWENICYFAYERYSDKVLEVLMNIQ